MKDTKATTGTPCHTDRLAGQFVFNYEEYNEFEKSVGELEERVIHANFNGMIAGNDSFDGWSVPQMGDAYWIFRHGWICARLAMR